jgi:hypothetical protein
MMVEIRARARAQKKFQYMLQFGFVIVFLFFLFDDRFENKIKEFSHCKLSWLNTKKEIQNKYNQIK